MSTLVVRLTRLNPTHHRFEAIRADGSHDTREFETKSLLLHDLVHFAVESEARLAGGFFGAIARGETYGPAAPGSEAALIETVVGPLQGALKGDIDPDAFAARLRTILPTLGHQAPEWLTPDFVRGALARLRQVQGQWRATPFGQSMELTLEV